MAESFGEVRVRDAAQYAAKNFRSFPQYVGRLVHAYRAKYITCKNARMTPFFHFVGVCIALNYLVDYKYHLKHEKLRKYH